MKKILLSIAILASTIFAFAGNDKPNNDKKCTDKQCVETAKCNKGKKGNCDSLNVRPDRQAILFKDINLTQEQKDQLAAYRQQFFGQKNQDNGQCKQNAKGEKPQPPTKEQIEAQRQQRLQNRINYLYGVKQVLTPEQYIQYLENNYLYNTPAGGKNIQKGNRPGRDKGQLKGGDRKGGPDRQGRGSRQGRPDRQPRANQGQPAPQN